MVHEVSALLPVAAICDMAGRAGRGLGADLPLDRDQRGGRRTRSSGCRGRIGSRRSGGSNLEFNVYNEGLVREREATGLGDDLLSDLMRAEVGGEQLTPREISSYFRLADRGGQRDDAELDHGRDQGAAGPPRSARRSGGEPGAGAVGGGGDFALDVDCDPVSSGR